MLNNITPNQINTSSTLLLGLACAVLNPALRTILVYNAPWYGLQQIADSLQILAESSGQQIQRSQLGSAEHDDDLWGSLTVPTITGTQQTHAKWNRARLFSPERIAEVTQLILIPDLTAVSQAVARACIMQMDANVVHLERHSQSAMWQPRQYWIANVNTNHIGMISPHVLDRFTLRLEWRDSNSQIGEQTRVKQLRQMLNTTQEQHITAIDIDPKILAALQKAQTLQPKVTPDALAVLQDYISTKTHKNNTSKSIYHRREIALARYALTLAQLSGDSAMSSEHVEQAAELLGISSHTDRKMSYVSTPSKQDIHRKENPPQSQNPNEKIPQTTHLLGLNDSTPHKDEHEVNKSDTTITQLLKSVVAPETPYLEDSENILIQRDEASLRLPSHYSTTSRADRGPIIGIEQSDSLRDIAIVSTLLQASLFQQARRSNPTDNQPSAHLKIAHEDLRRYRRTSIPEHMLLLLLDYTSLRYYNWQDTLLPYLSQAYVDRAHITIIKVGAQHARSELQAEQISERKVLAPGVERALTTTSGRATPLAHGLYLARQTLQKNMQHGRSTVERVTFIVISDGRGNVPLAVSTHHQTTGHVTREGITDALIQARNIRNMKHVQTILLNPQPTAYPYLPERLAEALNAAIIDLQTNQQMEEVFK